MDCKKCGTNMPDDAKFCSQCGYSEDGSANQNNNNANNNPNGGYNNYPNGGYNYGPNYGYNYNRTYNPNLGNQNYNYNSGGYQKQPFVLPEKWKTMSIVSIILGSISLFLALTATLMSTFIINGTYGLGGILSTLYLFSILFAVAGMVSVGFCIKARKPLSIIGFVLSLSPAIIIAANIMINMFFVTGGWFF